MLHDRRQFFVRQHAALFKLAGTYDILDPATQQHLATATEVPPTWAKYLRLIVSKGLLPTLLEVRQADATEPFLSLRRRPGFLSHRVDVEDGEGRAIGFFQTKGFSLTPVVYLHGPGGDRVGEVRGNWKGWDFTCRDLRGRELGRVTKKWAGIGKELFTTADSYVVSIAEEVPATGPLALLLLATGLAIDLALKEHAN